MRQKNRTFFFSSSSSLSSSFSRFDVGAGGAGVLDDKYRKDIGITARGSVARAADRTSVG